MLITLKLVAQVILMWAAYRAPDLVSALVNVASTETWLLGWLVNVLSLPILVVLTLLLWRTNIRSFVAAHVRPTNPTL